MHRGVQERLLVFLREFEGVRRGMYVDRVGLVTAGIGFMFRTADDATNLAWWHPANRIATRREILDEWQRVKSGTRAVEGQSPLLLAQSTVDRAFATQVRMREQILSQVFTKWNEFPADAQLGLLAHSWLFASRAAIEAWQGGRYAAAVREGRWKNAGELSLWEAIRNPSQTRQANRAAGMRRMFDNAAIVDEAIKRGAGQLGDILYFPQDARPAVLIRERR